MTTKNEKRHVCKKTGCKNWNLPGSPFCVTDQPQAAKRAPRIENAELIVPTYISFADGMAGKDFSCDEDMVRFWRSSPQGFSLQLRARVGIGLHGRGVKRDMIATASLNITDARVLVESLKAAIIEAEGREVR